MEETFVPFRGISNDLKGRLLCYKQDWTGGIRAGIRFVILLVILLITMEFSYGFIIFMTYIVSLCF